MTRDKTRNKSGGQKRKDAAAHAKAVARLAAHNAGIRSFFPGAQTIVEESSVAAAGQQEDLTEGAPAVAQGGGSTAEQQEDRDEAAPRRGETEGVRSEAEAEAAVAVVGEGEQGGIPEQGDIGLWPAERSVEFVEAACLRGNVYNAIPSAVELAQSGDGGRRCTDTVFYSNRPDGSKVRRPWLCYSVATRSLYCFYCFLLGTTHSAFGRGRCNDWKHYRQMATSHEQSQEHLDNVAAVSLRAQPLARVDAALLRQREERRSKLRRLLLRLMNVICFLAERGLAFRGKNQLLGSAQNGNYLGMLEVVAKYDDFLKEYLSAYGNRGTGHTNYLSASICNELIGLVGDEVHRTIVTRVKACKFFGFSLDSTPDSSNTDQLTVCLRYLENADPVERLLTLISSVGHKGEDMYDAFTGELDGIGLPLAHAADSHGDGE
eukprot:GHVU01172982.1.p1 GENE.GHVU01172982.1~~GHVU01172982.1.p1  ORF type:complete len:433 (-),score=73.54 GHVU01172982.1:1061-2359(-)